MIENIDNILNFGWLTWACCILVIGLSLVCYRFCWSSINSKKKSLNDIAKKLSEIETERKSECFSEIDELFEKDNNLKSVWSSFRNSMVFTTDIYSNRQVVYTSVDSEDYFNVANICAGINIAFWQNLGGIFTGLGILGTFFGLTIGVKDINIADTATMQEGIVALLGGLGEAFATSIVGITAALIFSYWHARQMDQLEQSIAKLVFEIDKLYVRKTTEQLLADNYLLMKEQTEQFKKFSTNLAISIGDALEQKLSESDMSENMKRVNDGVQNIHNYLVEDLADTISVAVGKQIEIQMLPIFEKLNFTIDKLNNSGMDAIAKGFHDSAGKELAGLSRSLESMTSSLAVALERMEKTSSTVNKELTESIENSIAAINKNLDKLQDVYTEREKSIRDVSEGITTKLTKDIDELIAQLKNGFTIVGEETEQLAGQLTATSVGAQEAMQKMFEQSEVKMADVMNDYCEKNNLANEKLLGLIERVQIELDRQQGMLEQLNDDVYNVLDKARETADKFNTAAEPVSDAALLLNTSVKEHAIAAAQYNKEVRVGIEDMKWISQNNTDTAKVLVNNLDNARAGFVTTTAQYEKANKDLEEIMESITKHLVDYDSVMRSNYEDSLKLYSEKFAAATNALRVVIEDLVEELEVHNKN